MNIPPLAMTPASLAIREASPILAAEPAPADSVTLATGPRTARVSPQADEADEYAPGQVLVKFRQPLDSHRLLAAQDLAGFEVIRRLGVPPSMSVAFGGALYLMQVPQGMTVPDAVQKASEQKGVVYAEPNWRIQLDDSERSLGPASSPHSTSFAVPTRVPNDLDERLWGLSNHGQANGRPGSDIRAPQAWVTETGKSQAEGGPLIAVIDTGIDHTHPDLQANMWTNPGEIAGDGIDNDGNGIVDDVHGANFLLHTGDPMDTTQDGHGTHVAGTVGAVGDNGIGVVGVNWNASIMGLRFLHDYGGNMDAAVEAILYASRMGARVINNSWGASKPSQALYDAIKASPALNVCAAGNSRRDLEIKPHYPASYDLPNILTVAATDDDDSLIRASNWGKVSVDVGAPGRDTYSTVPKGDYGFKTGTSMAAPIVTGVAALVLCQHPELTAVELKERLMQSVDKVPGLEGRIVTGGRINAARAVR